MALPDALDAGADDAVVASASACEIAARLARLARRNPPGTVRVGDLTLDIIAKRAFRGGHPLALLPREYALLAYLAEHAGRTVSRAALLSAVWNMDFDPGTNVVQVHVSRLRSRLDRGFDRPMLHTDIGKGYRLAAQHAA
nr:winged helix-turn-helix domain-containing protein [Stakelama flava]